MKEIAQSKKDADRLIVAVHSKVPGPSNHLRFLRSSAFQRSWFLRTYRIFFPKAESANSTARSAVRLCSSITGLTSTISKLVMRP